MDDTRAQSEVEWTAAELRHRLQAGETFFVLDVRNADEYESWKIEGRGELPMLNVPYYEMLEVDEHDDVVDTFQEYIESSLRDRLPRDLPILAVCAKGDTSEYVAEALRRLRFAAFNLAGGTAAWGNHYETLDVVAGEAPGIVQVSRPARGCLSWLVVDHGKAVVIDPLRHVDHYLEIAGDRGLEIELVLDTHAHADHISGGPELARRLDVPYHLHPYDGIHPIDVLPARIGYQYLRDGQLFSCGSSRIEALHIPGHTLGNMAYLVNGKYLFTGDSIFLESIARPDLGGRGDTWAPIHWQSLRRLLALPDDILVLPAHYSHLGELDTRGAAAAPLGVLRQANEGLRMAQREQEEFVAYILASLPKFPKEYVEIKRVNAGLVEVGEAKASELELGKNICALTQAYD